MGHGVKGRRENGDGRRGKTESVAHWNLLTTQAFETPKSAMQNRVRSPPLAD